LSGKPRLDRRARRTAGALLGAYNRLFLAAGGRARPTVAEIVAEADVGRSTFYEHHGSADALFLEALKRPFAPLADAAAGRGDPAALTPFLSHFWDQRARARDALAGRLRPRVAELFADMVEERLDGTALILPPRLAARTLAEAALAPLTAWLLGEAPASAAELAVAICRNGEALRHCLEMEPAPR
jgi:AcrR family transcriptional regulator